MIGNQIFSIYPSRNQIFSIYPSRKRRGYFDVCECGLNIVFSLVLFLNKYFSYIVDLRSEQTGSPQQIMGRRSQLRSNREQQIAVLKDNVDLYRKDILLQLCYFNIMDIVYVPVKG